MGRWRNVIGLGGAAGVDVSGGLVGEAETGAGMKWFVAVSVAAALAVVIQIPNVPILCGWWTWPFC